MSNQAFQTSMDQVWTPLSGLQLSSNYVPEVFTEPCDWLASVPAMPATVLALELLLQTSPVDLKAASAIVLSDVGATLHVLRLVSLEFVFASERPCRMETCLANLDVNAWFDAICTGTFSQARNQPKISAIWQHSRLIAQYARLIAESIDGVSADEAYMVGLLHEIETIPGQLDSTCTGELDHSLSLTQVLPSYLLTALEDGRERKSHSVWRYILSSAHALASAMPHFDVAASHSIR